MTSFLSAEILNFSWVENTKLAGCRGPRNSEELSLLYSLGVEALVRLAPEITLSPDLLKSNKMTDYYEPVPDWECPSQVQIRGIIAFIERMINDSKSVAVSCGHGYGRTGTILSCYFVKKGLSADEAIAEVEQKGRTPCETNQQLEAIREYEHNYRNGATE